MKMVDLSAEVAHHMVRYPSPYLPEVELLPAATHHPDCRSAQIIRMGTHISTHVDAPYHADEQGKTIDQIQIQTFFGKAHILRFGERNKNSPIDACDLETINNLSTFERIVLDTGWASRFWGTKEYFTEGPYLTPNAVKIIASLDRLLLLGMDFPNIDRTCDTVMGKPAPNHKILLGKGLVMIENLQNLQHVDDDFLLSAPPLKLIGGDGCPTRAIAVFPLSQLSELK